MAHALEYDDLHCELPIHSGVVVVPAALAVAEAQPHVTGAEVAAAILARTEVICRLARATPSYRGTTGLPGRHPTAVLAAFAPPPVAGRLLCAQPEALPRPLRTT